MMEENKTAQCHSGNLCVVKLRLEDEGVVNQKMYWIGKHVNRATCAYPITGVCSDQGILRRKCVAVFIVRCSIAEAYG
jgi:hypothetical protein